MWIVEGCLNGGTGDASERAILSISDAKQEILCEHDWSTNRSRGEDRFRTYRHAALPHPLGLVTARIFEIGRRVGALGGWCRTVC